VRLTSHQVQNIKLTAQEVFGPDVVVYLFGSRTDESRRGGDIDLYIDTPLSDPDEAARAKIRFLSRLKQKMGDQRIDLVLNESDETNPPPIVQSARGTGIRL
jgi:predicted nucleotidyltransferase